MPWASFLLTELGGERDRSEIGLDGLGGQGDIGTDGDGKLHLVGVGETIQPGQEFLHLRGVGLGGDDSAQAVDEHVGQIVVGGIHAADKALEEGKVVGGEVTGLHQTDFGADIINQLFAISTQTTLPPSLSAA